MIVTDFKELAHTIMEVCKYQDQQVNEQANDIKFLRV
jgi:hypothetical protein